LDSEQQLLHEFEQTAMSVAAQDIRSPDRPTVPTGLSVTHEGRYCVLTLLADGEPVAQAFQDVQRLRSSVREAGGMQQLVERHLNTLFGEWDESAHKP
jgi:hypothetical protein